MPSKYESGFQIVISIVDKIMKSGLLIIYGNVGLFESPIVVASTSWNSILNIAQNNQTCCVTCISRDTINL